MLRRELIPAWVVIILVSGLLLVGQDCPAQTDPCSPDPCGGIENAVEGSCHNPIPAGICNPADFKCDCDPGFAWWYSSNTCEEPHTGPMAEIPAGCFNMGDAFGEGDSDELPVHNVCIAAFEMDVHEVTNAEYAECVGAGGCTRPARTDSHSRVTYYGDLAYDGFPVIWVSWDKAVGYCAWAGKRLPTEAEWEYAARGGLAGKRYPWGDSISGADANYWDPEDPWDYDTSQVEYYAANGYGLYDVAGNVWEWVNDWYQSDYYSVSPPNDPPGPISGTYRVMRGGSWWDITLHLRVADRCTYRYPAFESSDLGFRCARGGAYGP